MTSKAPGDAGYAARFVHVSEPPETLMSVAASKGPQLTHRTSRDASLGVKADIVTGSPTDVAVPRLVMERAMVG
jgi:hypothetical protein